MFTEEYIQRQRDADAFRRLFTEILVSNFNLILTCKNYQHHLCNYLIKGDNWKVSERKLKDHRDAIDWLLGNEKDLCFRVLGIECFSKDTILKAITARFNSDQKFHKFFTSAASEYNKTLGN